MPSDAPQLTLVPKAAITWRGTGALLSVVVLCAGLAITWYAWRATVHTEARIAQDALAVRASEIQRDIDARLLAYEGLLRAGAGVIDAYWPVSDEDWRTFTNQLRLATAYPGIYGVGFCVMLRGEPERAHWARRIAPGSFYPYQESSTPWSAHSAVVLVEPDTEENRQVRGFDFMSEPVRREAILRARDQGAATISAPVKLIQQLRRGSPEPAFIFYVPVYEGGGVPDSLEARRQKFLGVVYSAFRSLLTSLAPI